MPEKHDLTSGIWEDLRRFLGTGEDGFAEKYGEIRRRLIRIFQWRGAIDPEQLADETIFRVARKCGEIVDSYVGDPALYFSGFARRVFLESIRTPNPSAPPPPEPNEEEKQEEGRRKEAMHQCLDECLFDRDLDVRKRKLILDYYRERADSRVAQRRALARELGLTPNALRIEAHRIRVDLRDCVFECLKRKGFE